MRESEIFYFDVDGTLFDNHQKHVHGSSIEALNSLKQQGYRVALCTGRAMNDIDIVKNIIKWDGYVLSNGSVVYDENQQILREITFEPSFIQMMIDASKEPLMLEGFEMVLTSEPSQRVINDLALFGTLPPVKPYTNQRVHNIICYDIDQMDPETLKKVEETATIVRDLNGNAEVIHKDSGKHQGCRILNQHLNVSSFTGFGDGENDIEFLKSATYAVAMGNAVSTVKDVADYVTDSVSDHGIYNALKAHNII